LETKRMLAPVADLSAEDEKKARNILAESNTPYESLVNTFPSNNVNLYTADGIEVYAIS